MEKRKQNRSFLAILIIALLACLAGFAATFMAPAKIAAEEEDELTLAATYYLGENGRGSTNVFYYDSFVTGWKDAVATASAPPSSTASSSYVKVILLRDWVASDTASGFGADAVGDTYSAFKDGRIYVRSGVNIVIDLNGHSIDRNLSEAVANGQVLYVQGNLTVEDTVGNGKITGGYHTRKSDDTIANYSIGGGVVVEGGTFNLDGGSIVQNQISGNYIVGVGVGIRNGGTFNMNGGRITENNHTNDSIWGGGVGIYQNGTFNMNDGTISNNIINSTSANCYGGGVAIMQNGKFNMNGGTISDNSAIFGGGIGTYVAATTLQININKGVIAYNRAVFGSYNPGASNQLRCGGGGIGLYNGGNLNIGKNAELSYNYSQSYGGGIYGVNASSSYTTPINMSIQGLIDHNMAVALDNSSNGGGISLYRSAGTVPNIKAEMTDAIISNNKVVSGKLVYDEEGKPTYDSDGKLVYYKGAIGANCQAVGAGLYISNSEFTMNSGKIINNQALFFNFDATADDASDIAERLLEGKTVGEDELTVMGTTYGGGLYVFRNISTASFADNPVGRFEMHDGEIRNNIANSGGAINVDGELVLYGGIITENTGAYGAVYFAEFERVTLSGSIQIKNNKSLAKTDADDGIPIANDMQVPTAERGFTIDGGFDDEAEIHVFVNEEMVKNGGPFTANYGENNRKFFSIDGKPADDEDNPTNGTYLYANPYRFFASDIVHPTVDSKIDTTRTVDQKFIVLESGEVAVKDKPVEYIVTYSDGSTKTFKYGEKSEDMPDWTGVTSVYGAEVYPVSISAPGFTSDYNTEDEAKYEFASQDSRPKAGVYTLKIYLGTWIEKIYYTHEKSGAYTDANGSIVNSKNKVLKEQRTHYQYGTFSVVVQAKPLNSNDVDISLEGDTGLKYNGEYHEPTVTLVKLNGGKELSVDVDYTVSYKDNKNAGENTAAVVITFIGNYCGTAYKYFTIAEKSADDTNVITAVEWQVYDPDNEGSDEDGWRAFNPAVDKFTYDGIDRISYIRAELTMAGDEGDSDFDPDYRQTVYAKGVAVEDDDQNTSMYLDVQAGNYNAENGVEALELVNAGTYSAHIVGFVNYPIVDEAGRDSRTINGIVINKMTLDIPEVGDDDFYDSEGARLFRLQIGSGDEAIITDLLDSATYIDPNAKANEYGEKITVGNGQGKYARFRNLPLSLVLNTAYVLKPGMTIQDLLDKNPTVTTTIKINNENVTTDVIGEIGKVTTVVTTVSLTFSNNYYLSGGQQIDFAWTWHIVTMPNTLRTMYGEEEFASELGSWTFGEDCGDDFGFRPEHGQVLIYAYYLKNAGEFVGSYALVYSNDTSEARRAFYGIKDGKVDYTDPKNDNNYWYAFNYELRAGDYRLEITVPENEPLVEEHAHWWDNDELNNDYGTRYYEFTYIFTFTVEAFEIDENDEAAIEENFVFEFPNGNAVEYTGRVDNVPHPVITFKGKVLVEGVDYELHSESTERGEANLVIVGKGSLNGQIVRLGAFVITTARNGWTDVPSIMNWTYKNFSAQVNLITATPYFPLVSEDGRIEGLSFAIASDANGEYIIEGLGNIVLNANGEVSAEVSALLNGLEVADYYLIGRVAEDADGNYEGIVTNPIRFHVFAATNSWKETPSVNSWTEGEYTKASNHILVEPMFGTAHIVITGADKKVYYDNEKGIDRLADAGNGRYTLVASVAGTDNYSALVDYTYTFSIFKKPGLPWWATMLIAVGALAIAALVLFILWKAGVFEILTEKIMVAIRTRASVDATIAAVRAAKKEDEAKKSIAAAEARERAEARKAAAEAEKALPPEERAAVIEAKAKAQAEKAEKMRLRAEKMQEEAEKVRQEKPAEEKPAENAEEKEAPAESAEAPAESPAEDLKPKKNQKNKK